MSVYVHFLKVKASHKWRLFFKEKTMQTFKKLSTLTLLTASLAGPSFIANADTNSGMRIAIIKGAMGSNDIINGNYQQATSKLASLTLAASPDSTHETIEYAMGLCAAFIKMDKLSQAKQACTQAIVSLDSMTSSSQQVKYLMAMSYSNRGIAKYLADDTQGAYDDMTTAMLIDGNDVVKENLIQFKKTVTTDNLFSSTLSLADDNQAL